MIIYSKNLLEKLKEKGYSTYKIRREGILSESVLTSLRQDRPVSTDTIDTVCRLLECQPGDIMQYVKDGTDLGEIDF